MSSTLQKYRKFGGGACSAEHSGLVEYSQHFISATIFKSLQPQTSLVFVHDASTHQRGLTKESAQSSGNWKNAV